jgi:hypothetical protein
MTPKLFRIDFNERRQLLNGFILSHTYSIENLFGFGGQHKDEGISGMC